MILDFLRKKEPEVWVNRFKYYPENISDLQDSSKSILNGTMYDMKRFSEHEIEIIEMVLSASDRKYKEDYRAIGLANECYPIKYKPRYILFEVLIQRYISSEKALDKVAVAFAYWSKGAKYYADAISYFEEVKDEVDWNVVHDFSSISGILSLFSDVYEKIHEYTKAIECVNKSVKYENLNSDYYKNRLAILEEKQNNWKPYRPRKMSIEQEQFERLVSVAAEEYV